jgi:hypothetical protein
MTHAGRVVRDRYVHNKVKVVFSLLVQQQLLAGPAIAEGKCTGTKPGKTVGTHPLL